MRLPSHLTPEILSVPGQLLEPRCLSRLRKWLLGLYSGLAPFVGWLLVLCFTTEGMLRRGQARGLCPVAVPEASSTFLEHATCKSSKKEPLSPEKVFQPHCSFSLWVVYPTRLPVTRLFQ